MYNNNTVTRPRKIFLWPYVLRILRILIIQRRPKDYKSYANIITHYSSEEEKKKALKLMQMTGSFIAHSEFLMIYANVGKRVIRTSGIVRKSHNVKRTKQV